jgi:DNA-binding transcriptional LysR family regulator
MPTSRSHALTPEALVMIDTVARTGSFAAAARELGKVPSALTYSVRQLEGALDVLLFDRSSRQAQLTAAGTELLHEGRRLLQELEAVANRVQRVACGWETTLSISVEDLLSVPTMFELVEAFCAVRDARDVGNVRDGASTAGPATRLRLRNDVLTGTWEALLSGQVDLAIGVSGLHPNPGGIEARQMGELPFVFCVAPHHPLAAASEPLQDAQLVHHRAIAVADTAQRMEPLTLNLLPGQDVLTVPSTRSKLEALLRGLGCGFVPEPLARPHLEAGHLVEKEVAGEPRVGRFSYAWRVERGGVGIGRALQWWLAQLERPATRTALLQRHAAPLA